MSARWLTLLAWALVAGTAVFWGSRLLPSSLPVPPRATVATPSVAAAGDLSRVFGADPAPAPAAAAAAAPPPPPEQSRFQLVGVAAAPAAPRSAGLALIATDGKPARAYRVGASIDGAYVLQDVRQRSVAIGPRGQAAAFSLELPPLPLPATGVPGGATGAAAPQPQPMAARPAAPVLLQPPPGAVGVPSMPMPRAGVAPSLAAQPPPALPGMSRSYNLQPNPGGGAVLRPQVLPQGDGQESDAELQDATGRR